MKYLILVSIFLFFPGVAFSDDCSDRPPSNSFPILISPGIASPVIGSGFIRNGHGTIIHQPGVFGNTIIHKSEMTQVMDNSPALYDMNGTYRGRLNVNRYDPDSISNPYGRYGNSYSPESLNNRFGAGSRFNPAGSINNFHRGVMRHQVIGNHQR
jgi:hypothetical protein